MSASMERAQVVAWLLEPDNAGDWPEEWGVNRIKQLAAAIKRGDHLSAPPSPAPDPADDDVERVAELERELLEARREIAWFKTLAADHFRSAAGLAKIVAETDPALAWMQDRALKSCAKGTKL